MMYRQHNAFKLAMLVPAVLVIVFASSEVSGQVRRRTGPEARERTGPESVDDRRGPEVHHHYYGPGYGGAGYGRGMTPAEGAGIGAGVAAAGRGQYNLDTSQAANIAAHTRQQSIQNHNYAVNSYYADKDAHDAYVAAHKNSESSAQMRHSAKVAAPGRLSNTQFDRSTNVIQWPALLRESDFTAEREKLDQLFHNRTPDNSGSDSENYVEIKQTTGVMHNILVKKLRAENLPAVTFIGAEHFIKSLGYEGRFAAK